MCPHYHTAGFRLYAWGNDIFCIGTIQFCDSGKYNRGLGETWNLRNQPNPRNHWFFFFRQFEISFSGIKKIASKELCVCSSSLKILSNFHFFQKVREVLQVP